MKQIFAVLSLLGLAGWVHAANSSLTVSSGTFLAIDGFNTAGAQFRQAVVIADPSTVANTASVDPATGLTVHLASSSATGIGSLSAGTAEIGNVKNSGTFAVQAAQSGAYIVTQSTVGAIPLVGGAAVTAANPLPVQSTGTTTITGSISNTGFNVNNSPSVFVATTSVSINGSSNTVVLGAGAATIGALTANQSVNEAQINGTTVSMGSGVNGTGVQRMTIATDQVPYGTYLTTSAVNSAGAFIVKVDTFANVAASQTQQILVSQLAATKICVISVAGVAGGTATNVTFNSSTTAISPLLANGANGGEILPYHPLCWFSTNTNENLTVTTGAGSTTGLLVNYFKLPQ